MAAGTGYPVTVRVMAPTRELQKNLAAAGKNIDRFSKSGSRALKGLAAGAAGAAAAVAGITIAAGKAAVQLDNARVDIARATGKTGDDLKALTDAAADAFRRTDEPMQAISGTVGTLDTLIGGTAEQIAGLTVQVEDFSDIAGGDMVGNAEALGRAVNIWGYNAEQTAGQMDVLTAVSQDYGITGDRILTMAQRFGPVMKNMGFEFDQTALIFGRLYKGGIDITRVMPAINKASRDAAKSGKDLTTVMADAEERIKAAATEAEGLAIATEVFGAEGAARLNAFFREGGSLASGMAEELEKAEGRLQATSLAAETVGEYFRRLRNNIMGGLGQAALPVLDALRPKMNEMADGISRIVDRIAEADVVGFFTNVKDTIDRSVMPRVTRVRNFVGDWWNRAKGFGRELSVVAGHLKPIADQKFDNLKELAGLQFENIQVLGGDIWENIREAYQENIPSDVRDAMSGMTRRLADSFTEDWDNLMKVPSILSEAWTAAQQGDFGRAGTLLGTAFRNVFDFLKIHDNLIYAITGKTPIDWAKSWVPGLTEAIGAAANEESFSGKFTAFFDAMFTEWKTRWDENIYPKVKEVWATIVDWFSEDGAITTGWNSFWEWTEGVFSEENMRQVGAWGGEIITSILDGLASWIAGARDSAEGAGGRAGSWAGRIMEFIFADLPIAVLDIVDGLIINLWNWLAGPEGAENRETLKEAFFTMVEFAGAAFGEVLETIVTDIPNKLVSKWSTPESWAAAGENWGTWMAAPFVRVWTDAVNAIIKEINRIPIINVSRAELPEWAKTLPQQQAEDREATLHGTDTGPTASEAAEDSQVKEAVKTGVAGAVLATPAGRIYQFLSGIAGVMGGSHSGGRVARTGPYMLEAGEQVMSRNQMAETSGGGATFYIDKVEISGVNDPDEFANKMEIAARRRVNDDQNYMNFLRPLRTA